MHLHKIISFALAGVAMGQDATAASKTQGKAIQTLTLTVIEVSGAATAVTTDAPSVVMQGFDPNVQQWNGCKPASPNPSVCSRTKHSQPVYPTGNGTSGADSIVKTSNLGLTMLFAGLLAF